MSEQQSDVAHLSEVTQRGRRRSIREHFDIGAFGVGAFTAGPGEPLVNEHTESADGAGQEELYFVVSGDALFTVDGDEVEAPAGTFVFVHPEGRRGAVARGGEATVFVVGAPKGEAYTPSAWEQGADFWPDYSEKNYPAAIEKLEAFLAENPDHRGTLYNLACCESLAGRRDDAIEHLRRAIEADDGTGLRELAHTDTDFDSLRGDPDFERLLGPPPAEQAQQAQQLRAGAGPAYAAAHLSEVNSQPEDDKTWHRVRRHFDVGAFGVNAYTASEAGKPLIEEHNETGGNAGGHEELYFVVDGRARFTLGEREFDAPAGTLVFVRDPETQRGAIAEEPDTTVLIVGGKRGEPYEVAAWEDFSDAWPYYQEKDYPRAIEVFRRVLEKHPDSASGLYNLACCESLAGEKDAAVEHLARAIELDDKFREHAKTDSDLDSIREDPRIAVAVAQ